MKPATIDELRKVIALQDQSDENLQWIIDHSELVEYADGYMIRKVGDPIDELWMMMEGKIAFYMDVNGRQVFYFNFGNDPETGGLNGLLPYSRLKSAPGYAYASGPVRGLMMHRKHFPELERLNPDLIQRMIGYMTERARAFATIQLQHDKVSALGKLSAGIAHELNNPASAISRIADELSKRTELNYSLTRAMLEKGIPSILIEEIQSLVKEKSDQFPPKKTGALERIELEDRMSDWLGERGINGSVMAAETLTEGGFEPEDFEKLMGLSGEQEINFLIPWLENLLGTQRLIRDMEEASARISNLVTAIKSHVHMDRTNELQLTNLHKDFDNTLTLLAYKIKEKQINIIKKYCNDLVEIPAYIGELNQVWTNLLDNAIFAVAKGGEITIDSACNSKQVTLKIIDNGSGIPPEIINKIFDPFFTTKKQGEGTGIGLDTVSRIIRHHNGDISVNSVPGKTEFIICIPVLQMNEEPTMRSVIAHNVTNRS